MDAVARLGQPFIDNLCQLSEMLKRADIPFAVIGASALLLHGVWDAPHGISILPLPLRADWRQRALCF
ncbi:hypothetical protein KAH43_05515 [Candidatus Bipolaricaulota bacterium]|nr:hypothetical protein [Candidatus Bipolaricaulota bacterium]